MAREYYRKSLELEDSFDTMCNLGRAEARSELWEPAYEHLRLCVELYPDDPDLADSKAQFAQLRDEVRKELTFEEAKPIEERVEAELERREQAAAAVVATEPEEEEPPVVESGLEEPEAKKSSARLPVSLAIGGVGVVGVGVGTALLIVSGNKRSSADDIRVELEDEGVGCVGEGSDPRCGELGDKAKAADALRVGGVVGLAAGGALLVGGVLAFVLWPKGEGAGTASVEGHQTLPDVSVSRDGGWTFGVRGSF